MSANENKSHICVICGDDETWDSICITTNICYHCGKKNICNHCTSKELCSFNLAEEHSSSGIRYMKEENIHHPLCIECYKIYYENKSKTDLHAIIESIPTRDYHTDLLAVIEFCKLNGFYYEFIGEQESDFSEKYDYHNNNYDGYKRYVMQIDMICDKQIFTHATYTLLDRLQDIEQCMYNDPYEKVYGLHVDNNIEIDLIKELYRKCDEKKIEFNTKYWYNKM